MLIMLHSTLMASKIFVTSNSDSGAGSLRQAVLDASDGDSIFFNLNNDTIVLSGVIELNKSLFINGLNGSNKMIVKVPEAITSTFRLFKVDASGKTIIIRNFNFIGGNVSAEGSSNSDYANNAGSIFFQNDGDLTLDSIRIDGGLAATGGLLFVLDGVLNISNSYFTNGRSTITDGGALHIQSNASAIVSNSTFYSNRAETFAGAIYCGGHLDVINSTFELNRALNGGGGAIYYIDAFAPLNNSINISGSTFEGNSAETTPAGNGGAVHVLMGNGNLDVNINNSTFNLNVADHFGGALYFQVLGGTDTVALNFVTIHANRARGDNGGGIYLDGGELSVQNCMLANNEIGNNPGDNMPTGNNDYYFQNGTLKDLSYNIVESQNLSPGTAGAFNSTDNILGDQNDLFGTGIGSKILEDNGGPTQTLNISSGSVAIGAGITDPNFTQDQRGVNRVNPPTIGAQEYCLPTTSTATITACDSYTWIDGITYTSSNNSATYVIPNQAGCDSTITLNLTINSVSDLSTSVSNSTITANNSNATYQWLDCDNNYALIAGETNQTFTASVAGNYAVELSENNCTDTSTCVSIVSTGINQEFINLINIAPNPSSGLYKVSFNKPVDNFSLKIMDINGRLISEQNYFNSNEEHIKIEGQNGIYLMEIYNDNFRLQYKLLKQ